MNFNLYLFGNPGGKYNQIPNDYISSDIVTYLKGVKSSRMVIMRKMDLMHYIYYEKLDSTRHIGFCLIFNRAYVAHPKQLVALFRDLIEDYLIKKGDIIRYTKEGELQYVIKSFSDNPVRYQKLHSLIKEKFENSTAQYGISELRTIFNGEHTSRAVSFNIDEEQIVSMSASYNTLIVDDDEGLEQGYIPQIISGLNNTISHLNDQNAKLQKQNDILNRQKKQMKWVLFLLLLLLVGGFIFYMYAQDTNRLIQSKSNEISNLNETIDDKNEQISSLNVNIKRLKKDSINLENELTNKTNQFNEVKQKLNSLHTSLNNSIPLYIYFPSWTSTNYHIANSTSSREYVFYAYQSDVLHIPYFVSSESCCDYLTITLYYNGRSEQILHVAGSYSNIYKEYTFQQSGTYRMVVEYSKDGSANSGNDNAGVNRFYLYRSFISTLQKMAEYNEE